MCLIQTHTRHFCILIFKGGGAKMKNVKSNPSLRVSEANAAIHESKIDGYFASLVKPADCYDLQSKSCNDDKNYKHFAICFVWSLFVACVISALLGILLYIYVPFMFFHKPYFREQTYMTDLRASARGIIDYAEFDSVILGSSMLENTSAREAGQKLGGKWVNLSMGGAHPNVRAVVLDRKSTRVNSSHCD